MTLEQFSEITNFVQKHHKFGGYKGDKKIQESLDDGISPDVAKYGYGIKYVRCDYDTRFGDVWGITFDRFRFATNHYNALSLPPKDWKYSNLYDLAMDFLKGEFKPGAEFLITN